MLKHLVMNAPLQKLAFDCVDVTEAAAFAAYSVAGRGNEKEADQKAVNAMRQALNSLNITGTVVIGEGERDNAPMLFIGEKVGKGVDHIEIDIALDPLEGTTLCAHNKNDALSVMAITNKGNFLNAPDVYMEKIIVGKNLPIGVVSLSNTLEENLHNLAQGKKCKIENLNICILNRPRHHKLIAKLRQYYLKVIIIEDGDVMASLKVLNNQYDMYIGIGGAPEGVLAASAVHSLNGQMEGRLIFDTDELKERAHEKYNITNFDKIYSLHELVKGESAFIATGVTSGSLLKGVECINNIIHMHSIIVTNNKESYISNCYDASHGAFFA